MDERERRLLRQERRRTVQEMRHSRYELLNALALTNAELEELREELSVLTVAAAELVNNRELGEVLGISTAAASERVRRARARQVARDEQHQEKRTPKQPDADALARGSKWLSTEEARP